MGVFAALLLGAAAWAMWARISRLERWLEDIERQLASSSAKSEAMATPVTTGAVSAVRERPAPPASAPAQSPPAPAAPTSGWSPPAASALRPSPPLAPSLTDIALRAIREYFTGGNLVVRVGIIVLIFGVGFLLKYAAEHAQLSIQMRLTGVALGAAALFALGWWLRTRRRGFSLALQGGAIGILYLNLFFALQFYQLLPAGVTFGLMAALGVVLCLLALWQDSLALSMLGAIGGFLAPVLASTGEGNHVMLFSYYALLNLFIVVQAWFKAWRPLNLLAFVFTFGVGTVWGVMRYEPEQFASTEPFLLYFFLAFIAIAVLFAHRTAPRLTHYVDGTLVFGTPVVAMALQMQLVRDIAHGRAWSAVGAGLIYLALAAWLQSAQRENLRLLKESFLALGVAFLTLAVPLWLNDAWTAATWALEGAALVWIGLRQARWLSTGSGVVLQLAAAVAYLAQDDGGVARVAVANAPYLGAVLLGVAGLISGRVAAQPGSIQTKVGPLPSHLLMAWGLGWWLFASGHEVQTFVPAAWQAGALLGLCAATALTAGALVRPLAWSALRVPALMILPLMMAAAFSWSVARLHPASEGGWLAWPAAFAVLWVCLWWHEASLSGRLAAVLQGWAVWLLALLVSWEVHWQVVQVAAPGTAWAGAAWGLAPAALLVLVTGDLVDRMWPMRRHPEAFRSWIACGLAVALVLWSLWINVGSNGLAAPLPYLPLVNPLDMTVALTLFVTGRWLLWVWRDGAEMFERDARRALTTVYLGATFCWLNAVLLRTMHHVNGVPYEMDALMADTAVQAALSIFWTLLALGAMLWANRAGLRVLWFGGASLMAVVVAKLFMVDLVRVGTVPRIVSFMVVGGLMLVIGYFSPLPPMRAAPPSTR